MARLARPVRPDAAEQFRLTVPFANPEIALALEHAAAGTFYSGPRRHRRSRRSAGSAESDLAAHAHDWVECLRFAYGGSTLLELPPNGQGSIAGWALDRWRRPSPPTRWKRWPAPMSGGTPGSAGRHTPVQPTARGWRYR